MPVKIMILRGSIGRIFVIILIVTFVTILLFFMLSEIILRNFTNYGIEYYVQLDTKNQKIFNNKGLLYVNIHVLKQLENLGRDTKNETDKRQFDNLYRIIVLGDSIANGGELKPGEASFPKVLNEILQKNYPEIHFEVLVFAEGGYSTTEEVTGYEKYCKSLAPDLVILSYCHNDTAEAYQKVIKRNSRNLLAFYKTGIPYLKIIPFNQFFTERFLIARFINESLIKSLYQYHLSLGIKYCLLADQKIYEAFKKLYTLTKDTNTPVIVVIFPYFEETVDIGRGRMSLLIKKWCAEFNFLSINLLEDYKKYNYKNLRCSPTDSCHPNALGHRIAAEVIAEKIKQNIFYDKTRFK